VTPWLATALALCACSSATRGHARPTAPGDGATAPAPPPSVLRTRFTTDDGEVRGGAGVVIKWDDGRLFLVVPHSTFSPQLGFAKSLTWDQVASVVHRVRAVGPVDESVGVTSTQPIPIPGADYAATGRADGDLAAFAVDRADGVHVLPLRVARIPAGEPLTLIAPAMRAGAGDIPAHVDMAGAGILLVSLERMPPLGRMLGAPLIDGDGALAGILIGARTDDNGWHGMAIGVEVIRARLGEALRPPMDGAGCTAAADALRALGDKSRRAARVPPGETSWLLRVPVPQLGDTFERFRQPMARIVVPAGAAVVRLVPPAELGENGTELPLATVTDGRLAAAAAAADWRAGATRIAIAVGHGRPAQLIADLAAAMPAGVDLALVGRKPASALATDAADALPGAAPWFLARLATFGPRDFAVPPIAELGPAAGGCAGARDALQSLSQGDPWGWATATATAAEQCRCRGLDLATISTIARYYIALRQDSGWVPLPRGLPDDLPPGATAADLMTRLSGGR